MITSTVITIVCNTCNKSTFTAKGTADFSKGNAYAAAFKEGWKYQSAEVQICPDCQSAAKAAKAAAAPKKAEKVEKVAKTGKTTKTETKKVASMKKDAAKAAARAHVSPKNNGADKSAAKVTVPGAVSTGKLAKSAKK